jgi:ATP-dependent Clp protease ATP-binding subunit ClpC
MNNSFSDETKQVISNARFIAERFHHDYISTTHILLGMVAYRTCTAIDVLEMHLDVDVDDLGSIAERSLQPEFAETGGKPIPFTPGTKKMMEYAMTTMNDANDDYIETFHLLLGILLDKKSQCAEILNRKGITLKNYGDACDIYRKEDYRNNAFDNGAKSDESNPDGYVDEEDEPQVRRVKRKSPANRKGKVKMLDQFSRNLNEMAKEGKLDNVIGRDEETERMVHILCRRRKSNPILTGEAGTGKTAVVDGLAQRIVAGDVPHKLKDKVIFVLDMGSLVAGTKYRGEFEKRLQGILAEVRKDRNIVLFIDEIHTVIGAGSAEGTLDASNLIKPALSRGELQCIGATTTDEYRKHFEKDNALNRRFQPIIIEEPNKDETIEILSGLKKYYEEYHGVSYSKDAISLIVNLTDRYVTDKFFPDKAIDAMDEIGAKLSSNMTEVVDVKEKRGEVDDLYIQMKQKTTKKDIRAIEKKIVSVEKEIKKLEESSLVMVSEDDIKNTMSLISGVPLENVSSNSDDAKKYLTMAEELKKVIINQDEAIDQISSVIKRSKAGIRDTKRPNVLMFIGPTGTGKTFLSKKLAEFLFGDDEAMIYIDCSELKEGHDTSKLIGSPPGYVGYDDAGKLERVRTSPYSVILLDECEKAHQDVWNIFLRIFEEGQVENAQGTMINFRNCIILMTSNIGSKRFTEPPRIKIGMGDSGDETTIEAIHKGIMGDVKKHFKPEFLNRLDDVVIFNQLKREDLIQIIRLEILELKDRLKTEKNISLIVTAPMLNYIAELADQESKGAMGARPLRRVIARDIESKLCDIVLEGGDKLAKITVSHNPKTGITFKTINKRGS